MRSILKFYKFYWHFIEDFSKPAKPFINLIEKNIAFDWSSVCKSAFKNLKKIITKALILVHYKQSLKTIIIIDLSNYISNRVFSQLDKNRLLHLIMFFFKNLNFAGCNYEIYEMKLLTIIYYFKE